MKTNFRFCMGAALLSAFIMLQGCEGVAPSDSKAGLYFNAAAFTEEKAAWAAQNFTAYSYERHFMDQGTGGHDAAIDLNGGNVSITNLDDRWPDMSDPNECQRWYERIQWHISGYTITDLYNWVDSWRVKGETWEPGRWLEINVEYDKDYHYPKKIQIYSGPYIPDSGGGLVITVEITKFSVH